MFVGVVERHSSTSWVSLLTKIVLVVKRVVSPGIEHVYVDNKDVPVNSSFVTKENQDGSELCVKEKVLLRYKGTVIQHSST